MRANEKRLWEVLVPCQWNDGTPVRTKHHKEWDKKVVSIAGGRTLLKPIHGQWSNDGTLYSERVIPVRIYCSDTQIKQIVEMTIQHYEQLAVMCYVVSNECMIVEASKDQRESFYREKQRGTT